MPARALLGTLWHHPDDGASVWIAGEMFVIAQTGMTWFGAYLGGCLAPGQLGRTFAAEPPFASIGLGDK